MSDALEILIGAAGTVGALLAVLLPVIRAQGASLRRELDTLRTDLRADVAEVRADVRALTVRVDALAERVARIEGAMSGPWRPPTNGTPAPAPSKPPEQAA